MIINVGSNNKVKLDAVEEIFRKYFPKLEIKVNGIDVTSEVSEQPIGLEEISKGAKNRAKNSFNNCDYSVGFESGLMPLPNSESGYQDVGICSIFDGKIYSPGMSSGFEIPRKLVYLIIIKKRDLSQAVHEVGWASELKIGSKNGIIGLLTNNLTNRKIQTMQAVEMAMPRIINPQFYSNTN